MTVEEIHKSKFGEIKTERLLLRPLCLADCNQMFEYTKISGVFQYIKRKSHADLSETKKFIEEVISGYGKNNEFLWGIVRMSDLIGTCRLFDVDLCSRQGELSYMLNPKYQNQGFMKEALNAVLINSFQHFGLNKVWARCDEENVASERVMQKIGMHYDHYLENYIKIDETQRNFKVYVIDQYTE